MTNRVTKPAGVVALLTLAIAMVIWEFGGGSVRVYGLNFSARSWDRPLGIAVIAIVVFVYCGGRAVLEQWISQARRRFRPEIFVAALCVTGAALSFTYGAHIAGGADSYGYVSQADLWRRGSLEQPQAFALDASWPNAQWSFTPLGYRPSVSGDAIVPTYSAGFPMMMAAGKLVAGQAGLFLIVPFCFAIAIWSTYRLGEIVCSPVCGLIAAVLLAVSPAVAFMAVWTMSDIPALAFWAACLATVPRQTRAAPLVAGLYASVALLIRPNLLPAAAVIGAWLLIEHSPVRRRLTRAGLFALGAVPGVAAIAAINARLFGSPLTSGYGDLHALFSFANVPVNLSHWLAWLTDTETWFVFLAFVPLLLPLRTIWRSRDNRTLWLVGPFALAIVLVYVAYEPFDAWWYLRFLLPVFPPLMVAAGVLVIRIAGTNVWRVVGVSFIAALFSLHLMHRSIETGLSAPLEQEARYYNIAKFLDAKTPPTAMFLTMQHSGSLRYYAHRLTMRFDWVDQEHIPAVLAWNQRHGLHPYVVVEEFEIPAFKQRFPEWWKALQPSLVFGYAGAQQVFVYDPLTSGAQFEQIPSDPIPLNPAPFPARNIASK